MKIAHQPGSEPLEIPEQIPNPAVQPVAPPIPQPRPVPKEPVRISENAGCQRAEFPYDLRRR
jgi:hypothetical protein